MDWDGYFLRYKEFSDKLRNEFLEKIEPATMERAQLEFESALAELVPEIKDSVLKCAEKDFQWLSFALDDSEKKWFVASVLSHLQQMPEKLFKPMIRAAVYEINPSANREFVKPCLAALGPDRVHRELLDYVERGSDFEIGGAVNALYWAASDLKPTDQEGVALKPKEPPTGLAELFERKKCLFLKTFVGNDHVEVRQSIIPSLEIDPSLYPDDLKPLVEEAIQIAQNHPDEFIRHRIKIKLNEKKSGGSRLLLRPLPHREPVRRRRQSQEEEGIEKRWTLPLSWIFVIILLGAAAFFIPWCK